MELGEQARAEGVHPAYHTAVMEAYWSDGRNIADPAVLEELALGAGVSAEGIEAALHARAQRDAVDRSTATAHAAGITAVPAFVIDERVLVLGAQPHEAFERAVAMVRDEPAA